MLLKQKSWIICDLKALLKEKKRAFLQGDEDEEVQRQIRVKLRQSKDNYRRKLENQIRHKNMEHV